MATTAEAYWRTMKLARLYKAAEAMQSIPQYLCSLLFFPILY
jgi:hypothetical protein